MKLNKKTEKLIKKRALAYKEMLETPCPEVDAIIAELKESAKSTPKGMMLEEELAFIMGEVDDEIRTSEINELLKGGKE